MASYDIIGNIVIIKPEGKNKKQKLAQAKKLLKIPSGSLCMVEIAQY